MMSFSRQVSRQQLRAAKDACRPYSYEPPRYVRVLRACVAHIASGSLHICCFEASVCMHPTHTYSTVRLELKGGDARPMETKDMK